MIHSSSPSYRVELPNLFYEFSLALETQPVTSTYMTKQLIHMSPVTGSAAQCENLGCIQHFHHRTLDKTSVNLDPPVSERRSNHDNLLFTSYKLFTSYITSYLQDVRFFVRVYPLGAFAGLFEKVGTTLQTKGGLTNSQRSPWVPYPLEQIPYVETLLSL